MKNIVFNKSKKIITLLIVLIILGMFITSNVRATPDTSVTGTSQSSVGTPVGDPEPGKNTNPNSIVSEAIGAILGGVVGLLTIGYRFIAMIAAFLLTTFTSIIALIDGAKESVTFITPFHILFNYLNILDINFFDVTSGGETIKLIRGAIAGWYYALRLLSLSVLLVILIYVGIKMAISTIASEQARYKKMLVDWVASISLVFVLHYVILSIIYLNDAIVEVIKIGVKDNTYVDSIKYLMVQSLELNLYAIVSTVILCMISFQTFGFFITYFNRMLKVGFLIIISPLITITYSIDKMGDGKAQALNNWFKEFLFTVIIQPFHCIMYVALVQTGLELIANSQGTTGDRIMTSLVAFLLVRFLKSAEKIVKKIFGIKSMDDKTSMARAIVQTKLALNAVKGVGKNAKNFASGTKNTINKARNLRRNATIQTAAAYHFITNKDSTSYDDELDKATVNYNEKEMKKMDKKMSPNEVAKALKQAQGTKGAAAVAAEVAVMKEALIAKSEGTMDDKVAQSQAEYEVKKKRFKAAKKLKKQTKVANTALAKKVRQVREKRSQNRINNSSHNDSTIGEDREDREDRENRENREDRVDRVDSENNSTKKSNAVVDLLRGFKEPIREIAPDVLKNTVSGGMALFGGSGMMGTGANLVEATLAGGAFSKEFGDFMDNKNSILSKDALNYAKRNNINSVPEMKKVIDRIQSNSEIYDPDNKKSKEKIKKLVDDLIGKMEIAAGTSQLEDVKKNLTSIIKSNSSDATEAIQHELSKLDSSGKGMAFTNDILDYMGQSKIYQDLQSVQEDGGNVSEAIEAYLGKFEKKIDSKLEAHSHVESFFNNPNKDLTLEDYMRSLNEYNSDEPESNAQRIIEKEIEEVEERIQLELAAHAMLDQQISRVSVELGQPNDEEIRRKIDEKIEVSKQIDKNIELLQKEILPYLKSISNDEQN